MLHCGWACSQTEPRGSGASIPSQFPPEPRTSECSSLMDHALEHVRPLNDICITKNAIPIFIVTLPVIIVVLRALGWAIRR